MKRFFSRRAFLRGFGATAAWAAVGGRWARAQAQAVKIAVVPGSIGYSDVYAGVAGGFFAAHGLEVELISFLNGALVSNALAAGEVDFAPLPGGYVPFVRPAGLPYKLIAARTRLNGFSLVSSLPAPADGSLAPLRGQTVAVEALGSTITWAMAVNYLSRAGLNFETDVNLVAVGGRATAAAALQSGQAAATVLDGPSDVQLVQGGAATRWIDPLIPAQHRRWVGNEAELALAWITREDVIARQPERVQALVDGARAAQRFLSENAGATAELVANLSPFFQGLAAEVLAPSLARFLQTLLPDVAISRTLYGADLDKWVGLGLVQPVPFEEAVEGRFADVGD